MADHEDYKVIADLTDHIADASAHHVRYSDAEARAAINDIFGADGKADADIDLDGQILKGGSIQMPDNSYIGIGPALERIVFDEDGDITFMGCKLGIGTPTPGYMLEIAGSPGLAIIGGNANQMLLKSGNPAWSSELRLDTGSFNGDWGIRSHGDTSNFTIANKDQGGTAAFLMTLSKKVGISISAPTAYLHLRASLASADCASLKIDPGVVATIPVSGNIESDGTNLYWTDSGGTRRQLNN